MNKLHDAEFYLYVDNAISRYFIKNITVDEYKQILKGWMETGIITLVQNDNYRIDYSKHYFLKSLLTYQGCGGGSNSNDFPLEIDCKLTLDAIKENIKNGIIFE